MTIDPQDKPQPLVEQAPDEAVTRALAQSAHPVEFVESNEPESDAPDES
jgi:hypothetical protein